MKTQSHSGNSHISLTRQINFNLKLCRLVSTRLIHISWIFDYIILELSNQELMNKANIYKCLPATNTQRIIIAAAKIAPKMAPP